MAASISCLCRRSITTCPIQRRRRENAGVSCASVATFASAPERENDVVVPNFFPAVRSSKYPVSCIRRPIILVLYQLAAVGRTAAVGLLRGVTELRGERPR